MMKDVVCGMDISENKDSLSLKHEGKEYAFCSPRCRDKFEKSPQNFTGNNRQPNPVKAPE